MLGQLWIKLTAHCVLHCNNRTRTGIYATPPQRTHAEMQFAQRLSRAPGAYSKLADAVKQPQMAQHSCCRQLDIQKHPQGRSLCFAGRSYMFASAAESAYRWVSSKLIIRLI
jgi:hypothetical protein